MAPAPAPLPLPPLVLRAFPLPGSPDPVRLLRAWGRRRGLVVLDSAGGCPADWSLVAFDPLGGGDLPTPVDLEGVRRLARSLEAAPGGGEAAPGGGEAEPLPGPFHGGFIGALAYDLGVAGEDLALPPPPDPWVGPPVVGGLYTDFALLDHRRGRGWLVLGEGAGGGPGDRALGDRPPLEERRASLLADLAAPPSPLPPPPAHGVGPLVRRVGGALHRSRIERARGLIEAGEIYQANLAHPFIRPTRGHPLDLYLRLRRVNPAPHMAYLSWGEDGACPAGALLSASPELLLECTGERVRTRPIKGTAGRGATPAADARARAALLASVKDRAELAMIVDLERNDLGRVCRPGSVGVEGLGTLRTYAAVHHLEADVCGRLKAGLDGGDALAALFPGGSVTGAPKLRAMEVIAELEGEGRGFFCGAAGFLDRRGRACFNILIRTLVWRPTDRDPEAGSGEVSFHVGGAITHASRAWDEERETLQKGAALAASLSREGEVPDTLGIDLPGLARA